MSTISNFIRNSPVMLARLSIVIAGGGLLYSLLLTFGLDAPIAAVSSGGAVVGASFFAELWPASKKINFKVDRLTLSWASFLIIISITVSISALAAREYRISSSSNSIAVLPFYKVGVDIDDALADNLTELLIYDLSKNRKISVRLRDEVWIYKGTALSNYRDVAYRLRVSKLLVGEVRRFGDSYHLNVELIDVEKGVTSWGAFFDIPISEWQEDITPVTVQIVDRVTEKMESRHPGR